MFDPANEPAVPIDLPGIYDTFDEARRASFVNAMNYKQEGGKLCGAVTGKEIAGALKEQFGMEIDGKKLVLDQPIKSFGSYEVKAKLGFEVSGTVYVLVIEEK